jgi:hypothetical protein
MSDTTGPLRGWTVWGVESNPIATGLSETDAQALLNRLAAHGRGDVYAQHATTAGLLRPSLPPVDADLVDILQEAGFTPADDPGPATFDRGPVRLVNDDGEINVYRFTDTPARLLEWSARFSSTTPLRLIVAALRVAGVPID